MERLKSMKEMLTGCVQGQLSHLDTVDAKELGEAVDMIKDLAEAIYYCTITEAMESKEKHTMYYPVMYYKEDMPYRDDVYSDGDWGWYRDMDRQKGRMYYDGRGRGSSTTGGSGSHTGSTGVGYYTEREMPLREIMRDHREGRSPLSRKMYMESKDMHKDKAVHMQELEKYAQELTTDLMEMIENATPEEKQLLSSRIATLATKIK